MVDERLKKYFHILTVYHRGDHNSRPKMLDGFFRAASMTEKDPFTRSLLVKFHCKESMKYAPANSNPEPPRRA